MVSKKRILFTIVSVVLLIIFFAINQDKSLEKSLKSIHKDDVKLATVSLRPPHVSYELNYEEVEELLDILHTVEIYNKDNSYVDYVGQSVIFSIVKKDGRTIEIMAYNPFLVIDGTGYRTKYDPCEKLSVLGNKIGNLFE